MGKLSEIAIPTREVPIPGSTVAITLRGLSTDDLEQVFELHGPQLTGIFNDWVKANGMTMPEPGELIKILRKEVPAVLALMIALANDEPHSVATVGKLPGATQILAAVEVMKLTFHSVAELKKILEAIVLGMEGLSELVEGATESMNGASASGVLDSSDGSVEDRSASSLTVGTRKPGTIQ